MERPGQIYPLNPYISAPSSLYFSSFRSMGLFFLNKFCSHFYFCFWQCWIFSAVCGLFSVCGEQGLLFVVVCRLVITVASLVDRGVQVPRLQYLQLKGSRRQAQQLWHTGLGLAARGMQNLLGPGSNPCPCTGKWIANHSVTREDLAITLKCVYTNIL